MPTVEFGRLDDARKIRNDPMTSFFLEESDDGRQTTVRLKENVPDNVLSDIRGEAAESRQFEREKAGQASLTDTERKQIDFSQQGVNVPKVRSIKGVAENEGVDDWMGFADLSLTVDENRSILKRAKREERGQRMDQTDSESFQIDKEARAYQSQKQEELPRAKKYGFEGDREAQEFVSSQGPRSEVFDIGLSRSDSGVLTGSGQDFDRLMDIHEDRSQRAQTLDEKKNAKRTRDPFEWSNNPGKFDFPGIDTVQPKKLHEQRSAQARAVDERDSAPLAESDEQWAMNPDKYDLEGVDDVDPEKFHAARSERARTIDEKHFAPFADTKQQWARNPQRYDWPGVDVPDSYGPTMNAEIPSTEQGTNAPETLTSSLSRQDISLSPGEAFDGVGSGSMSTGEQGFGFASDDDIDFSSPDVDPRNSGSSFVDDRDRQGGLTDFGMEADVRSTQGQESRMAVEQATEFGVDDRNTVGRGVESGGMDAGEQGTLFEDVDKKNKSLFDL